jgi:hypothetical protein
MDSQQAAEHLEVIRTLMERSAIYRRALAPVMTLAGTLGIFGALAGWLLHFESPFAFSAYWLVIGILTAISAFLLVRQQAVKQREEFWSPPTRRVVHAMLPALLIGFLLGVVVVIAEWKNGAADWTAVAPVVDLTWLPLSWILLYGCALHAAGFFTPRGLRWFGWLYLLAGSVVLIAWSLFGMRSARPQLTGHLLMGIFFGVLHLAYGTYLSVTEKRKNAT